MPPRRWSRREFLAGTASLGAALGIPGRGLLGVPGFPRSAPEPVLAPVRIRGRVTALGRGVAGASVSDGRIVVSTEADGEFQLISEGGQRFLSLSPPSGYVLPADATGITRLYRPIQPSRSGEASARFTLSPMEQGDEVHACIVLADPQTQDQYEMTRFHRETVPDVQATVRGLGDSPIFGVSDGDIMYDRLELYPEYVRAVTAMGIPFFQVVGNHDLDLKAATNETATATFSRHFGPTHYSFNRGRIHYVVLNDVFYYQGGYLGYVTADQLQWLEADLARVEKGSTVVVFLHIPLRSSLFERHGRPRPEPSNTVTNRDALLDLLAPYRSHLVSGHTHECEHRVHNKVVEHTLGAVCGGWWTGDLCYDGSPNGYGVFEARGEELRWRYKATGAPAEAMARVYPVGSDPAAPQELVANVWDWDPSWRVVWYEDGDRRGAMARRNGLDPVAVRTMTGPELPARRGWVEPVPTAHLFYAPVSPGAREVRVEVRDGFGRTWVTQAI
jgi:hypothetical protein